MKVAFGLKAHSGWAALVAVGKTGKEFAVVDRRRIELVEKSDVPWAKQPYHAADQLEPDEARELIKQATKVIGRIAEKEIRAAVKRTRNQGHEVTLCAVLVPNPMPAWSVDEILAVHFRMHQAEGVLFPEKLIGAAEKCGLRAVSVPEKTLNEFAVQTTRMRLSELTTEIQRLGKVVGPPWGKDQKNATLAAIVALHQFGTFKR